MAFLESEVFRRQEVPSLRLIQILDSIRNGKKVEQIHLVAPFWIKGLVFLLHCELVEVKERIRQVFWVETKLAMAKIRARRSSTRVLL